ncbi:hypothetical protein, partial [Pantoea agglomerans]|uniref:hypothetical protein n=1 Tax=Enterobacter agglomerans TaxID=549 RepID=UPI001A918147
LSDKLLKSMPRFTAARAAYITLSALSVKHLFSLNSLVRMISNLLNPALRKPLCRVSGGAL